MPHPRRLPWHGQSSIDYAAAAERNRRSNAVRAANLKRHNVQPNQRNIQPDQLSAMPRIPKHYTQAAIAAAKAAREEKIARARIERDRTIEQDGDGYFDAMLGTDSELPSVTTKYQGPPLENELYTLFDDEDKVPKVKLPGFRREKGGTFSAFELSAEFLRKMEESEEWKDHQRRMDKQAVLNW